MTLAKSEQSEARSVSGIIPHSGDETRKASGSSVIIHRCRKLKINKLTFRNLRKKFYIQVKKYLKRKTKLKNISNTLNISEEQWNTILSR